MTTYIENLVDQIVNVISNDGRCFVGTVKSFDQAMNMMLKDCMEKVYSKEKGVEFIKLGAYFIRGDNVAIVSEVDPNLEQKLNYQNIKANPPPEMKIHL